MPKHMHGTPGDPRWPLPA